MSNISDFDDKIMQQLREPINELMDKYCINQPIENRMRLRQLAWYAVDILIHTDDVSDLRNNDVIQSIIENIKTLGASNTFIDESINLAITIYNRMKLDHPELLIRYKV